MYANRTSLKMARKTASENWYMWLTVDMSRMRKKMREPLVAIGR